MHFTKTITKKLLESIVQETFFHFGSLSSSSLLDSLKLLGFHYATNAGISINIEDLKTPNIKQKCLDDANLETQFVSNEWRKGLVSDNERFQSIIDSWNNASESLKSRITDYYQQFDPLNNLYIMAFSGARGNMDQVRQLVGMRGLMSDNNGQIIDLPIQRNFREGLSSIDYIISSYGARKGIVDTALKTADSGYLTRRLIYVAQDLVIREFDCKTKTGLILFVKKKTSSQNFLGRSILNIKKFSKHNNIGTGLLVKNSSDNATKETILDSFLWEKIQKEAPVSLHLRSSLTCNSHGSVCQKCYGWDLAHRKLISLGEVVGILAAQSIGEPGTQLTMRTFHTGGVFSGSALQKIVAPFSGKLLFPSSFNAVSFRTSHGMRVARLQQELIITLCDWKGKTENISLEIGSFLYLEQSDFVQQGQLIAEYSIQSVSLGAKKSKPIYTSFSGEIHFENIVLKKNIEKKIRVTADEGTVWVSSGVLFRFPPEVFFDFPKTLKNQISIAKVKIVTPHEGFILLENNQLSLINRREKKVLDLRTFLNSADGFSQNSSIGQSNCLMEVVPIIRNYQFVDSYTVIGFFYFLLPNSSNEGDFEKEEEVFAIREQMLLKPDDSRNEKKKNSLHSLVNDMKAIKISLQEIKKASIEFSEILIIRKKDTWAIESEQITNTLFSKKPKRFIRNGMSIYQTCTFQHSGLFLRKQGMKLIFQHALPIFLSPNSGLYFSSGYFVKKKELLASLIKQTQQTEDIVQGLPKIEELIEARRPQNSCQLAKQPIILLEKAEFLRDNEVNGLHKIQIIQDPIILAHLEKEKNPKSKKKKKLQTQFSTISNNYQTFISNSKREIVDSFTVPFKSEVLHNSGQFIDIGQPITEGKIDMHDLLAILFAYHVMRKGMVQGTLKSLTQFQLLLVNSIQAIYQSQGVNISSKHIEIIVRQMTSKVTILDGGTTPFFPGELLSISLIIEISKIMEEGKLQIKIHHRKEKTRQKNSRLFKKVIAPIYEPKLRSATNSSLTKEGFLSSAGFQETRRVLTKAAISGSTDWLRNVKESLMSGRIIPAGSSFLNYKNYLNSLYNSKE